MAGERSMLERGRALWHGMAAAVVRWLPEWRVFVRLKDGRVEHFTVGHTRQLVLLLGAVLLSVWAGATTTAVLTRPEALAEKERELEQTLAAYRVAQQRLDSTEKMVAGVTREVDEVHSRIVALAKSTEALSDSKILSDVAASRPKVGEKTEPAYDDQGQPGSREVSAVRAQLNRLESALESLRSAYGLVAQQTAQAAGSRMSETEAKLSRLGIDLSRMVGGTPKQSPGLGGPFIPAPPQMDDDSAVVALMDRVQRWDGMKSALQRLPLAAPIRSHYDFNSGFGTRNDPLNNRTGIHEGIDLGAPVGTPVYATGDGVVTLAQSWDRYGQTVDVTHGNGISTRYAHLSQIKVKVGQRVTRSTILGLVGSTGRSTGSHLHYEVRLSDVPKDPVKFISAGRDVQKYR